MSDGISAFRDEQKTAARKQRAASFPSLTPARGKRVEKFKKQLREKLMKGIK